MKTIKSLLVLLVLSTLVLSACAEAPAQTPTGEPDVVVKVGTLTPTGDSSAPTGNAASAPVTEEVMTVLEAIDTPVDNLPASIEGNPPADFGALGIYLRQVMEDVVGYRTQGAVMAYTCPEDGDLFISTDPGQFLDTNVPEGGVVRYPCSEDEVVTFSTPHFSQGQSHQQVTVAFVSAFPKFQGDPDWAQRDALVLYMKNEGKPHAYYFYLDADNEMQLEVIDK